MEYDLNFLKERQLELQYEERLSEKIDLLFSLIVSNIGPAIGMRNPYYKLMGIDRIKQNLKDVLPEIEKLEQKLDELKKEGKEDGSKIEEN